MRRQSGFTIFEMVIVLIMVGILTAGLAPSILSQHNKTMEEKDRAALEDAKTAIINYAISYGGIPDPLTADAAGGVATPATPTYPAGLGVMPPSDTNAYAVPAFGVNNWGAFGSNTSNFFRLDVNAAIKSNAINKVTNPASTSYTGGEKIIFCQAVNQAMLAAAASPQICQNFDNRAPACNSVTPVAFVLFSTGNDRASNQENDEASAAIGLNNRIYENDRRSVNNTPDASLYDDQVISYPMSALARDCREKMGVALEAMSCAPGEKYVGGITNNTSSPVNYTVGGSGGSLIANATALLNGCYARTATVVVGTMSKQLSTLDPNSDGRVDVLITGSNSYTTQ